MEIVSKKLSDLKLDSNNARFAELYTGSDDEDELIEYLLYTEAAEIIAKNISQKVYYPDEVLWVVESREKFMAKDGNRRLAAVKALQKPEKYGLSLPKQEISSLPVLIYKDETELENRIREHHANPLFKEWDPIAKALKMYEMHQAGFSEQDIKTLDSDPKRLINLASFYYKAVKIADKDLKYLLRRGRGKSGGSGGKTIIFERLFKFSKQCGYKFKNKPSYEIEILDENKFKNYVEALVAYLHDYPSTSHKTIDEEKSSFLKNLKEYGFEPSSVGELSARKRVESKKTEIKQKTAQRRGSVKTRPTIQRKHIHPKLEYLVDECYKIDSARFANARVALSRITFEAVLKYVVDETRYKNKKLCNYNHFRPAFYDKKGNKRTYTNFNELKNKFVELISDTGEKRAFEQFDRSRLDQIIHNYRTTASQHDAQAVTADLIHLIDFLLQDEDDLISSLDVSKLV